MNKKSVIITLSLVLLFALFSYFFIVNEKAVPVKQLGNQDSLSFGTFFTKDQILLTDIVIKRYDQGFTPDPVNIKKGTRVVWVNDTQDYIWPASNLHPSHTIFPEFDPKEPLSPGQAWGFVFEKVGDWEYHDHLRPNRRGTVKVQP